MTKKDYILLADWLGMTLQSFAIATSLAQTLKAVAPTFSMDAFLKRYRATLRSKIAARDELTEGKKL